MSVSITKATIATNELPVGDLVAYSKDAATNMWSCFKCSAVGALTVATVLPVPPSSFSNTFVAYSVALKYSGSAGPTPFTDIVRFSMPVARQSGDQFAVIGNGGVAGNGGFVSASSTPSKTVMQFVCAGVPSLLMCGGIAGGFAIGLGSDASGQPYPYIHTQTNGNSANNAYGMMEYITTRRGIDISKCMVSGTSILNFGTVQDASGDVYVLLNNQYGYMARVPFGGIAAITYTQLYIPAGGLIHQFANGYYIVSDAAEDYYLYSMNGGGTLITQLDVGVYDPTIPAAFFDVV